MPSKSLGFGGELYNCFIALQHLHGDLFCNLNPRDIGIRLQRTRGRQCHFKFAPESGITDLDIAPSVLFSNQFTELPRVSLHGQPSGHGNQ